MYLTSSEISVPGLPAKPTDSGACKTGFQQFGDDCFGVFSVDSSEKNFNAAKLTCTKRGAGIATITNIYEHAFLHTIVGENGKRNGLSDERAWIGLREANGALEWDNKCPVTYSHTTDIYTTPQDGTCFFLQAKNGNWAAQKCDTGLPFVLCEQRKGTWAVGVLWTLIKSLYRS